MAERNIRIENPNKHAVTINLKEFNNRVVTVVPKGFAMLEEDELAYVVNTSSVFQKGTLKVVNSQELKVVHEEDIQSSNSLSDDEVVELLKLSQKGLTSALADIDNVHILKRILEKAEEKDKSVKVIGIIESRIEELLL